MALVVIDMQEKLAPHIEGIEEVLRRTVKLVRAIVAMNQPVIFTEQIKLGKTVEELASFAEKPIVKSSFSCYRDEKFRKLVEEMKPEKIILTGIETHICVLQTAIDMKKAGYDVYVVADCTGSRRAEDRKIALMRLATEGIKLTTWESITYQLLESAEHPAFKDVLQIVKDAQ
jgi:nicotinamidase-related amidase